MNTNSIKIQPISFEQPLCQKKDASSKHILSENEISAPLSSFDNKTQIIKTRNLQTVFFKVQNAVRGSYLLSCAVSSGPVDLSDAFDYQCVPEIQLEKNLQFNLAHKQRILPTLSLYQRKLHHWAAIIVYTKIISVIEVLPSNAETKVFRPKKCMFLWCCSTNFCRKLILKLFVNMVLHSKFSFDFTGKMSPLPQLFQILVMSHSKTTQKVNNLAINERKGMFQLALNQTFLLFFE